MFKYVLYFILFGYYLVTVAYFDHSGDSGKLFNYSKTVLKPLRIFSAEEMNAYLSKIQRDGVIQLFGCMVVFEESSFRIIG